MAEEKKLTIGQRMGITRTVIRPPEESDIRLREDRIKKYFKKYIDKFVFAEFSDEFLEKSKVKDIMKGIPIPLRKRDLKEFAGGEGLTAMHIGENMAWVMGCDPGFKYTEKYIEYLKRIFNYKIYEGMLKEGRDAAEREDYDFACIHFRASLCMQPEYIHGMYSYARCCRAMYLANSNTEYVGRFKAEALDWFELLTETHPRFASGFYYLGYAYLNIGLYVKADIAWKSFLSYTHNGKDRREIQKRRKQLSEPVKIERGCNEVMAGRFQSGLKVLEPFLDSRFKDWWPLYYYIGVGYARAGRIPEAVAKFKHTLTMNPSHLETMEELMEIYKSQGDKENYAKYEKKVKLIRADLKEEAKEFGKNVKKTANVKIETVPKEDKEVKESEEAKTKAGIKRLK